MAVAMNLSEKVMKHVMMYCLVHKVDLMDAQMKEAVRESVNRTGGEDCDCWPGVVRNVIEDLLEAEKHQKRPQEQIISLASAKALNKKYGALFNVSNEGLNYKTDEGFVSYSFFGGNRIRYWAQDCDGRESRTFEVEDIREWLGREISSLIQRYNRTSYLYEESEPQEEAGGPEFLKSDIVIDDALVDQMFEELEQETALKEKLAAQSKLAYDDGQPVKLMDVFVDEADKRRFEAGEQTFGYHMLVHRINEDETIDVCIGCNIASKMNSVTFDPSNSTLLYRNGIVRSPMDEIFKGLL